MSKDILKHSIQVKKIDSVQELCAFEEALFKAFNTKNPNNWLCNNYLLIDGCKYRSTIPYEDQIIYGIIDKNVVEAAIALNHNTSQNTQIEALGFQLDHEILNLYKWGEILNLFSNLNRFSQIMELIRKCKEIANDYRFDFILTTSSQNMLPMYKRFGCEIIEEQMINGEMKYLLLLNFSNKFKS